MEIARDLAIIILVIGALILCLTSMITGIIISVSIIEVTMTLRRALRRAGAGAAQLSTVVDEVIGNVILPPLIRYERIRSQIQSAWAHVRRSLEHFQQQSRTPNNE